MKQPMDTAEGVLIVYGKPGPDFRIITKDAAINAAQKAKEQGKILDYRVEEETDTTGKIIATVDAGAHGIRAKDALWYSY